MSARNLGQQFFYMGGRPHNLKTPTGNRTLFRNDQNVLGDWQGDIENPVKLYLTDDSASVLKKSGSTERPIAYTPYGNMSNTPSAGTTPGYNGELLIIELGLYLLGIGYNRPYSFHNMRFTCPDTLSPFDAGGINAYSYCGGDPINNIDPSGHMKFWKGVRNIFGRKESLTKQVETYNTQRIDRSIALNNFEFSSTSGNLKQLMASRKEMLNKRNNLPRVKALSKEAKKYREKHYSRGNGEFSEFYKSLDEQQVEVSKVFYAALDEIENRIKTKIQNQKLKEQIDRQKYQDYLQQRPKRTNEEVRNVRTDKRHFQWEQ